jgi:hypothetical protein
LWLEVVDYMFKGDTTLWHAILDGENQLIFSDDCRHCIYNESLIDESFG